MNVLVTGASRGIGRATAILAGSKGWNVGVNYVASASSAESTVQEIKSSGGNAVLLQGDISVEDDVIRIFDEFHREFGSINGVVINAGVAAQIMPLANMSAERMKKVFDTDIFGAYLSAREAARRVVKDGSIVIMSSKASVLGSPNEYVDYAGSKGAMDTLTIGLSKELGPSGVRVNAIRPGAIRTDIHAASGDAERVDRIGNAVPLGRAGDAMEVAEAVLWLLGSESSYITGAILDVAGGR